MSWLEKISNKSAERNARILKAAGLLTEEDMENFEDVEDKEEKDEDEKKERVNE